jgi:sulfur-carrier protein adenylyltransferase/sulfurtransferase
LTQGIAEGVFQVKIACAIDEVKSLSPGEVKTILDKDAKGEYILLDVRQPEEYEAGHIPGATLISLGELEDREGELDRDKKIIAYCRSGRRSMAAAIALCGLGFKGVHHLDGGILSWAYERITGMPERRPELVTEVAGVRDILMLGIKLEKGSWDFYTAAKDKVASPQVEETFRMLANAEDGHMQRLYQRAITLLGEETLASLKELKQELKAEHMEGGMEISPALTKVEEKFVDEMEALEIALEMEYMAYDFYKRASALVENPDAKTLLHELALEERNHANTLLERVSEITRQR